MNLKKIARTVNLKKIARSATLAGALSAPALGIAGGIAGAKPTPNPNPPSVPVTTNFDQPPGQVGQDLGTSNGVHIIPPGQFNKSPQIAVVDPPKKGIVINNPYSGIPPGQWRNNLTPLP